MAKRFIDTGLFDDAWFMDLSKDAKIAWIFLITKCDHAGIIQVNERLFKVQTGVNSFQTVREELAKRLVTLRDSYFFIPRFITYQYPDFPKSNVNQQAGAIKRLKEFGLFDEEKGTLHEELTNTSETVKEELINSYGNGNDNVNGNVIGKGGVGEKPETPTWRQDFTIYQQELRQAFQGIIADQEFIKTQERFNPQIDVLLSLEKACVNFWGTEAGWRHKKKGHGKTIDWKSTLASALSQPQNKVFKNGAYKTNSDRVADQARRNNQAIMQRIVDSETGAGIREDIPAVI